MKDVPKIERPREKMEKYGPEKLKDEELLAILLRTGLKGMNVVTLSKKILSTFREKGIGEATVAELKTIKGLGAAKACEIVACFELGKRLLKDKRTAVLLTPKDVWERMEDIRGSKKEHFVVFSSTVGVWKSVARPFRLVPSTRVWFIRARSSSPPSATMLPASSLRITIRPATRLRREPTLPSPTASATPAIFWEFRSCGMSS